MDEGDRDRHPPDVRDVGVGPVGADQVPGADHPRQVLERLDVGDAEHLVQRRVGRFVQLLVPVQRRVHEADPVAGVAVAGLPALGRGDRGDGVEQLRAPALVAGRVGVEVVDADGVEDVGQVQPRLQLRPGRGDDVGRDLRYHRRAHPLQPGQHRAAEGGGAEAVGQHLDALSAGQGADLGDRGRVVAGGDVIGVELRPGAGQVDAGAVVEQPDVVAVGEEELEQVGLDRVDREDAARDAETVGDQERAFIATAEAGEPELDPVVGLHPVDLGRVDPQATALARPGTVLDLALA